jgi:uncharacterized membrane protein YgcG
MAAVIVLGLLYTLLASTAVEGLRSEGTSRRRLEASLLADEVLYDLEGQMLTGALPEEGRSEDEVGDYRVTVDVLPFDPTPFLPQETEPTDAEIVTLLGAPAAGEPSLIRIFEVAVSWSEGFDEHRVRRTTFAYDVAAVAPLVQAATGGGGAGAAGAGDAGDADRGGGESGGSGASQPGGGFDDQIQRMLETLRNAR